MEVYRSIVAGEKRMKNLSYIKWIATKVPHIAAFDMNWRQKHKESPV